jgi:branched-chain amino acid transport system ATP-binding protein
LTILSVQEIDSRYGLLQAVRGVSFEMDQGETVALIGANGAGKTTLLRTIAGAHRPHGGRVVFDGLDVTRMPAHRRVSRGIAMVPEGRRLFPGLTVEENLGVAVAGRVICMLDGRVVLQGEAGTLDRDRVVEAYFGLSRPVGGLFQ